MKTRPTIEELKQEVTKLKSLLDDPQPGLMTWHMFVNEKLKYISDAYNFKEEQS